MELRKLSQQSEESEQLCYSDARIMEYARNIYCRNSLRIIKKNGIENVTLRQVQGKPKRYVLDLITTLIELDWKYMLILFLGSYIFNWLLFGTLNYWVSYRHGDITGEDFMQTHFNTTEGYQPCIIGATTYLGMIIYAMQIQTTNGYGEKYPTEDCPWAIVFYIMQIIFSIGLEGAMVSVIYWKTARPAKQMTKLKFSEKAVICYRDGKLCLIFRVCDPRKQQTINAKVRVYMITDHETEEGENVKPHIDIELVNNGEQMIEWPELICHIIDDTSPLKVYAKSAKCLNESKFELCVSIVGTSSSSAMFTEARTSYVSQEILWGQRFVNIISYDEINGCYLVDYSHFNTIISVDMPEYLE